MEKITDRLYHKIIDYIYETGGIPGIAEQAYFNETKDFCSTSELKFFHEGQVTAIILYRSYTGQYVIHDYVMNDSFRINNMEALIEKMYFQ